MKSFLLIFAVFSFLFCSGTTPEYGPTDYNVITSTSQGFIVINDLSIGEDSVVYGTNNNTASGYCPSLNCDIIAVMYGDVCVGWSYSTLINNQIFITVNFNDQITPNLNQYPYPGDFVTLNFFDASEGILYFGIASTQIYPLTQSTISNINITGDGNFTTEYEGCPLSYDEFFDPFAGAGNCSLCSENYSFCGCTDPEAYNFEENATVNSSSCDYPYFLEHQLDYGNNLVSFPGNFENSNTLNILSDLIDNNVNINFIMGQGLGMFNTQSGWSGNLNNLNPYSGYWINISTGNNWGINFDRGDLENCEAYEFSYGNNLFSYKWGEDYAPTMDALGGEEFATEKYNFILGKGVGLFNTSNGWAGNLNYLQEGKGYWINFKNTNFDFKWGFDDCANPPNIHSLNKLNPETELPEEFHFTQSTEQSFYLIHNKGNNFKDNDILLAYNKNTIVGAAYFNPKITVLPVMGKDLSDNTLGYCEIGENPKLKLYKSSTDEIIDLNTQLDSFENLKISEINLSIIENQNNLVSEFEFKSIYPNPFNPSTNIRYSIPKKGYISISVMDISGRNLTEIENGYKNSGDYSLNWNADNFASGTYFIKIDFNSETSQVSKTQKIVLIK